MQSQTGVVSSLARGDSWYHKPPGAFWKTFDAVFVLLPHQDSGWTCCRGSSLNQYETHDSTNWRSSPKKIKSKECFFNHRVPWISILLPVFLPFPGIDSYHISPGKDIIFQTSSGQDVFLRSPVNQGGKKTSKNPWRKKNGWENTRVFSHANYIYKYISFKKSGSTQPL